MYLHNELLRSVWKVEDDWSVDRLIADVARASIDEGRHPIAGDSIP